MESEVVERAEVRDLQEPAARVDQVDAVRVAAVVVPLWARRRALGEREGMVTAQQ